MRHINPRLASFHSVVMKWPGVAATTAAILDGDDGRMQSSLE